MSPLHFIRRMTAQNLRQRAQRYRNLALSNGNDQDVGIINALAVECDERALRIEQETSAQK